MSTQTSPFKWDPSKLHFEFPLPNKEARFRELFLYISQQCLDDPTFSSTKLNKVLFYSDFEAYGRHRIPITGMSYRKLPHGPAPRFLAPMRDKMIRDRLIRVVPQRVHGYARDRVLPLRDADCDLFTSREISIVHSHIQFFWNKSAKEISEYSHGKAWSIAAEGELIPYEAVFISDDPVTEEDVAKAKELAEKYGWKV